MNYLLHGELKETSPQVDYPSASTAFTSEAPDTHPPANAVGGDPEESAVPNAAASAAGCPFAKNTRSTSSLSADSSVADTSPDCLDPLPAAQTVKAAHVHEHMESDSVSISTADSEVTLDIPDEESVTSSPEIVVEPKDDVGWQHR